MSVWTKLPHPDPLSGASYSAAELMPENDAVVVLDQRLLPLREDYLLLKDSSEVARAIRDMIVRGAPAIGVAAAYGMALAARRGPSALVTAGRELRAARPTAVNLAWAVERMLRAAERFEEPERARGLADEARQIHREDVSANRRIGELGAELVPDGAVILTHCNAGALATGGFGTALGIIRAAHALGKVREVLADETRPWLQGARLTAWELQRDGIPVKVICDGSAGSHFARGTIQLAIVGADRIARNGDVANKIGTYTVGCLARHHRRPMYVAAPWSTVDFGCESGAQIPIEERSGDEVTEFAGRRVTPEGIGAYNPSFDVTPAELVSAVITERGVAMPPSSLTLERLAAPN